MIERLPRRSCRATVNGTSVYASVPSVEFEDDLPDPAPLVGERGLSSCSTTSRRQQTVGSQTCSLTIHHCNASVAYLLRTCFIKVRKTARSDMVMLKSPRDTSQVTLRVYPGRVKSMQDTFVGTTTSIPTPCST